MPRPTGRAKRHAGPNIEFRILNSGDREPAGIEKLIDLTQAPGGEEPRADALQPRLSSPDARRPRAQARGAPERSDSRGDSGPGRRRSVARSRLESTRLTAARENQTREGSAEQSQRPGFGNLPQNQLKVVIAIGCREHLHTRVTRHAVAPTTRCGAPV
jgi:hypothetical protein